MKLYDNLVIQIKTNVGEFNYNFYSYVQNCKGLLNEISSYSSQK